MRISVIGSGYVGLVTGTCLADSGNHVACVDKDERKLAILAEGKCPFYEPGLEELMRENLRAGRLKFTSDLATAVGDSQVVFIAVGTPPRADGSADLSAVEAVAAAIGDALRGLAVVVTKSTVPVGTGSRVEEIVRGRTKQPFSVVSNPEFLKEGAAVDDFLRPDRVVIGANDPAAGELIAELYKPFVRNNKPILHMTRTAAEMTKYAANAYLATRISFINEMAAICEGYGINIDEVRRGIGSDERIGFQFLYPGIGYGGSCFPKDVQALASTARLAGVRADILDSVHRRNLEQRESLARRVLQRLGPNARGTGVAVWGLAFKPKTDDIREAPAISIVSTLLEAGVRVAVHDPRAIENARALFGDRVSYHEDAYAALPGADALLVLTEWNEYRNPDFERIARTLRKPLIFDGRNIYDLAAMTRYGIELHSVGRPVNM
ncbi:MAG: UDP-glucose/GDP-mannose dehydrogenase family protein [Phycisphaerales bacterium]|nr:UDP-glucose/GDP-mannose dehydrogenase family protein [Phycisphaerales bacterium]